ncbi:MAG TPA: caspase family protein, partial [Thermoanaerobaculia bacterium]|nr:caspase family protein [Thermoanaerobaculia bacterium]
MVVVASLVPLGPALAQPASVPAEYRKYFVHYREDNRSFLDKALTAIGLKDLEVGRSFALVAGVDTYPSLPAKDRYLEPARVDLEKVVGYLRDYEFFDEIILLRNEAVTDANFKYFLQGYLPPRLKASEKSRLLFAYSGHGIQDGPRGYLLQASARSFEDLVNTISLEALSALYRPATEKAFQSLALINACHSGSFGAQTFGPESERRLLPRDPGSHVITAGATNQPTWHLGTVGPGSVFFEKVLAGLGGWADSYPLQRSGERGDGVVTATELYEYLSQEIQLETNQAQQPRLVFFSRDKLGSFFFLNRQRQVRANMVPVWEKWRSPFGFGEGGPATAGQELVQLAAQAFGRGEYERSTSLYRQGCESGNLRACAELGWAYRGGVGMEIPDPNQALPLYERACAGGDLRGCAYLGAYYLPDAGGAFDDPKKAIGLFRRACDGGDQRGCVYLGAAQMDGEEGLAENPAEGARLVKLACDRGDSLGCAALALLYLEGEGELVKDRAKALTFLQGACDSGEAYACSALGELFLEGDDAGRQDPGRAMALYRRACDGGEPEACAELGRGYESGSGGLRRDSQRAVNL